MQKLSERIKGDRGRLLMLFAIEGILFQFTMSLGGVSGFGTNLYATNMGATDTQIGMIQLVANLTAVLLLIPVGIISDRLKNAKTMPVCLLTFVGVMFFFYGTVPVMGANRLVFFFIFLALTAGVFAVYNSIWQAFFGDVTEAKDRNFIFTFRSRFLFVISTIVPIVCGAILTSMPNIEGKLIVLRISFYACGLFCLLNALVLFRMKGGQRPQEQLDSLPKFSPTIFKEVFGQLFHDRRFVLYLISIMIFYISWHMDWSMWYIGQTQYVGMSEVQLSIFSALNSVIQLFLIGFFSHLLDKKGVQYTFLYSLISLVFCPVAMLISGILPFSSRVFFFIPFGAAVCALQAGTNLCTVQMLLAVAPEKNRSLIVSLNMALVTLSNALLPFLGVRLYNVLGADWRAFMLFNAATFVARGIALVIFFFRWKRNALQL